MSQSAQIGLAVETDVALRLEGYSHRIGLAVETDVALPFVGVSHRIGLAIETDIALPLSGYSVDAWPFDELKPRHIGIYPVAATIGGGVALTGKEPAIDSDNGHWRIAYDGIPITTRDRILRWREFEARLEGRGRILSVPIYDGKRAPWLTVGGAITATANASAAAGATALSINIASGGVPASGMHFSVVGRLHRIIAITSTVGSVYGANIWPKLREDVGSGTALEFRRPTCRCRLASDDAMSLDLELLRIGEGSVSFEEAL